MKILQIVPSMHLTYSIWEELESIAKILRDMGVQTGVYCDQPTRYMTERGILPIAQNFSKLNGEDVLIYHKCINAALQLNLSEFPCRKLMRFHGCIPPIDFHKYHTKLEFDAKDCQEELCEIALEIDYCVGTTSFHKSMLQVLKYEVPIAICPPITTFQSFLKTPDSQILEQYEGDNCVNFLYAEPLMPQHHVEDVIQIFYYYQKYCNAHSRLFLVGDDTEVKYYTHQLKRYVEALELDQVIFTGRVTVTQQLSYFRLANLYVDASGNTEFCPSLIEAMYFGVPVLANDNLNHRFILGEDAYFYNNPYDHAGPYAELEAALLANHILTDLNLRREIIAEQRRQQQKFSYNTLKQQLQSILQDFLETVSPRQRPKGKIMY